MLATAVMHDNSPPGDADAAQRAVINLQLTAIGRRIDALSVQQRQPGLAPAQVMSILAEIAALQKEKVDLQTRVRDIRDTR